MWRALILMAALILALVSPCMAQDDIERWFAKKAPRGVGALWTPALLTNPIVFWGDASSPGYTYTNNQFVDKWKSVVGGVAYTNNSNFASGWNPRYATAGIGGIPAMKFDGVGDGFFVNSGSLIVYQPFVVFIVAQRLGENEANEDFNTILSDNNMMIRQESKSTNRWVMSANAWVSYISFTNADNFNQPNLVSASYNTTASELCIGSMSMSGSLGTNTLGILSEHPRGWMGLKNVSLGASTAEWNGYIAEILIVSNSLDSSTMDKVRGYLKWKYSLTNNLPTNSAYLSAPPYQ